MASDERTATSCPSTQDTLLMALSSILSFVGSRAWAHQPRDTTTMKTLSFPPEDNRPQSPAVTSSCENGQLLVSLHSGWQADHHCTQQSSNV
jgi:hypothetical protein